MQKSNLTDLVLARIGSKPVLSMDRLALWFIFLSVFFTSIGRYGDMVMEVIANRHSASTAPHRILLGGHRLLIPENLIRDASQRQSGELRQLDLYMTWPELSGFSFDQNKRFNTLENVIFLSLHTGAIEPVTRDYRQFTVPGEWAPSGLELRPIVRGRGFDGEVMAVGERPPAEPFLARCLSNEMAGALSAPCERHLPLKGSLVLVYRFPAALLAQWRILDDRIRERVQGLLQDG